MSLKEDLKIPWQVQPVNNSFHISQLNTNLDNLNKDSSNLENSLVIDSVEVNAEIGNQVKQWLVERNVSINDAQDMHKWLVLLDQHLTKYGDEKDSMTRFYQQYKSQIEQSKSKQQTSPPQSYFQMTCSAVTMIQSTQNIVYTLYTTIYFLYNMSGTVSFLMCLYRNRAWIRPLLQLSRFII
jgi:hypothetical protein